MDATSHDERSGAAWLRSLTASQRRWGLAATAVSIAVIIWLAAQSRGGTSAIPVDSSITPAAALANLRAATGRGKRESKRSPNPGFGTLSLAEWNLLYLRHAELHLSYCVPLDPGSAARSQPAPGDGKP